MSATPAHRLSATITTNSGGTVSVDTYSGSLRAVLAPFFKGDPGDLTEAEVQAIAATQDSVQVYDYDALVSATLSI